MLSRMSSYNTPISLIDDGQWHSYSITFNSPIGQPVRLMLEDWDGSNGVAGDAYFDNLRLHDSQVAPAAFADAVPRTHGVCPVGHRCAGRRPGVTPPPGLRACDYFAHARSSRQNAPASLCKRSP